MDIFNNKGLLNPGFCEYKLEEIEKIFVTDFLESQTRKEIYKGFLVWLKSLLNTCVPDEIWIDGSFATTKINPNDIDLICFINFNDFLEKKLEIQQLRQIGLENKCDTYIGISPKSVVDEKLKNEFTNNRNYWRGQFGFDREDNPKGMIKINIKSLEFLLREGIEDV